MSYQDLGLFTHGLSYLSAFIEEESIALCWQLVTLPSLRLRAPCLSMEPQQWGGLIGAAGADPQLWIGCQALFITSLRCLNQGRCGAAGREMGIQASLLVTNYLVLLLLRPATLLRVFTFLQLSS